MALVAVGLLISACGGDGGEASGKTVIRFTNWAAAEENTRPGMQELVEKFERTHPNIEIEMEAVSYTDIEQQVVRAVSSGNAPDVAELQGNYTFNLAGLGALQPLDSLAGPDFAGSMIEGELELGRIDGELLAIPWTVAPFGFWYNKKVLRDAGLDPDSPPQTIEELLEAMATIRREQPDVIPLGLDSTNRPFGLDSNWPWMLTFGAQPFEAGKPTANTPAMKQYLEFMRTLAREKYTLVNTKAGDFRQPAASNEVAFLWDGPYPKGVIQAETEMSDEEFFETWGVTTLPAGPSGETFSVPTDHQLSMLRASENKQAAWEFMEFVASEESAVRDYTLGYEGSLPPLADPPQSVTEELDNPIFNAFREEIVPTVVRPEWGAAYGASYATVMVGVQQAMTSSDSIDAIAENMQAQLENNLVD